MSTVSIVDGRGGRCDLLVQYGSDMPPLVLTFTNDDGTATDFTGATLLVRAATRGESSVDLVLVATCDAPTSGVVTLSFARSEIAKLTPPATASSKPLVSGDWALDMETVLARTPLLFGELSVAAAPGGQP